MYERAIKTTIVKSNPYLLSQRMCRISEALELRGGTIARPKTHFIAALPKGKTACFVKPGKEAKKLHNPNINDMLPWVGRVDKNDFEGYTFEMIWEYLVQISLINNLLFKKILVLLYRNCYFVDHVKNADGNIRYCPSAAIRDCIAKIDYAVQSEFKDKFKPKNRKKFGLLEFLHFIDLLGWNEDVKYHVQGPVPCWRPNRKSAGRPNTIISVISVPLTINDFLANIMKNIEHIEKINVRLILSAMQQLSKSRGVCVLPHKKLKDYLSPYLE